MPYVQTDGPVIGQNAATQSVPLNIGIGAGISGFANGGIGLMAQQLDPLGPIINSGTAAFLNIIAQPLKHIPWLDQNKWLGVILLVIGFVCGYFLIFGGEVNKAFLNGSTATITAIANYKADKAAGTNLLQPVKDG